MPRHPNPDRIRDVVLLMETLPWFEQGLVHMSQGVPRRHKESLECIACHGGWCALATVLPHLVDWIDEPEVGRQGDAESEWAVYGASLLNVTWDDGAERLSRRLGVGNHVNLVHWARDNPALWGNEWGVYMFDPAPHGAWAFDQSTGFPVQVIADHWRDVALRIETEAT